MKVVLHIKPMLVAFILAVAGYIFGNYYLLLYPIETLKGLSGFPASYRFNLFMVSKTNIIWDHVADLPFGIATYCLLSVVILMFMLPIVCKKWSYLAVSGFMTVCLTLFITFFSTGNCWHGFTTGLFLITYTIFILTDVKPLKLVKQMVYMAIICQILTCFAYYIPKQVYWFNITNEAVEELEVSAHNIYDDVKKIMETVDGSYTVDVAVKRYMPVPVGTKNYNSVFKGNKYFAARNYSFLNPLEANSYFAWRELEADEKFMRNDGWKMPDSDYIIYIIPSSFMKLSDVADINKYDDVGVKSHQIVP